MKRISIAYQSGLFLVLMWTAIVLAQPPRGPWVISPQVNNDHTVVFRYLAPKAEKVMLNAQFAKGPIAMTKGEYGIWSVTIDSIAPDIYPYSFNVDGTTVMDPANVAYFPNERFKGSLVDIPGETPLIHAMQDVPHGTVTYEYYPSVKGITGSLVVYTPPGYEQAVDVRYPVFYLIGGTTDTEETWFKVGKANLILDNLIAQGKAEPMIIVMPYGNVEARLAEQTGGEKPNDPRGRESEEAVQRAKMFGKDLVEKIIPYIENEYRVVANADHRAIGGFSRGGGQTLRTAFDYPDMFSWICCYSAYLSPTEMQKEYAYLYANPDETNKRLKLFWVSVGNEDFLYQDTLDFLDFMQEKDVHIKTLISSGGHTWMNTKLYLNRTAQLLFQ